MKTKVYLAIEVKDRRIHYVMVKRSVTGQEILRAGTSTVKVDVSVPGSLYKAVQEILNEQQVVPVRIFLSLSRRDVIVHQVVLPKMNAAEFEQVVEDEVEKIPVFRNRQFVFIHKIFPHSKEKRQVVLAAMDQATLSFFLTEIHQLKAVFQDIEIVPLNMVGLIARKQQSAHNEALLVINHQFSHFVIFNRGEFKLFYTSSIGDHNLLQYGTNALEGRILGNLAAEIKRILKSYFLEHKHERIERLWLVWDSSLIPELDKHFSAQMEGRLESLTLEKIAPFRNAADFSNPVFTVAATPLIYHFTKQRPQFPLEHFFRSLQIRRMLVKSVATTSIFIFLTGLLWFSLSRHFQQQLVKVQDRVQVMEQHIRAVEVESRPLLAQYNDYLEVRRNLVNQATFVKMLNRVSWSEVFAVVAEEIPEELALTEFHFQESGIADFKGEAFQMEAIANLIRRVENSAILEEGKFDYLKEKKVEDRKIYDYGIFARLRTPAVADTTALPATQETTTAAAAADKRGDDER